MNREQWKLLLGAIPLILLMGLILMGCMSVPAKSIEDTRFNFVMHKTAGGLPIVYSVKDIKTGHCYLMIQEAIVEVVKETCEGQ